jgi:non-lysosomal glucosylceramidase
LMCTFPRPDWDYRRAAGAGPAWATGYFNEVMTGFEHQVAAHMLWENMVPEALAIEKAIDDRYDARRRNPWNEVECGSHYARAMASYGVFLAACGFEYDGPNGYLAFAPRLSPEKFRAAFTTAAGWGSFSQQMTADALTAEIELKWGTLNLRELGLSSSQPIHSAVLRVGERLIAATPTVQAAVIRLKLARPLELRAGETLNITLR